MTDQGTPILDWVSPLRPAATDIAEYTVRVQQALAGRYDLNAIDNDTAGDRSTYVFKHEPFFNIGNDRRFHSHTLATCRAVSGILIAHDYRIQDLVVGEMQAHPGWEGRYSELMARHYGAAGQAAAQGFLHGLLPLAGLSAEFPGIEIAAEKASCIITHNPALADELARRTGLYCATLPLPFPVNGLAISPPAASDQSSDQRKKLSLLVFGYLGHNRGLEQLCELVASMPDVELNLAGQIGPETLRAKIDGMKAAGCRIIDHGFVSEPALDRLIRTAELVVNLRYPSMGEVSGSQLRIFANQGASVVCNTGWYASLPGDTVLKVDPRNIEKDLAGILEQLVRDRSAFHAMRLNGYHYVKAHHSLERFASAFDAFMADAPEALAHGRQLQLAKHMAAHYEQAGAGRAISGEALLEKAAHLLRATNP